MLVRMEEADELPAASDAQFAVDIGDVILDGMNRDEELLSYVGIASALQDKLEDAGFPRCEAVIPAEAIERLVILHRRGCGQVGVGKELGEPKEWDEVDPQQSQGARRESNFGGQ